MKKQQDLPGGTGCTRAVFVSRWLFSGAFLGLVIGLAEAARLWTSPRVIPLLVPDVGWVIWFLAPLVDMIFFGLAGLALGWLSSRTAHKEVFVAAYAGLAVTFVYLMVKWFHVEIGLHPFDFTLEFLVPLMVFAVAFVVSLVVLAVVWQQVAGLWERWIARLINLVSDATGPWRGMAYLNALDGIGGGPRVGLLRPRPFLLNSASNSFRIGMSQAFFKPDGSEPARPTRSERDAMRSLPYQ